MPVFSDQLNRKVEIPASPQRIVSLVPSQTELLHDLGLDKEVIGITKFCVHPEAWFNGKKRIGGTKQLHLEKIRELNPDLIIANKEENVQADIEQLAKDFPVWVSDINNLANALEMILAIGGIVGKTTESKLLVKKIGENFALLDTVSKKPRVAYFIWKDPLMTVGGDTFIHDMMNHAGLQNIFGDKKRYPEITAADLANRQCEILLLPSEPYPFKQKHADEFLHLLPDVEIILVDGEMFSWYGSRLLKSAAYFQHVRQVLSLNHAGNR